MSTDTVKPAVNSDTMYSEAGSNPARECEVITPSDVTEYEPYIRALRVGLGGGGTVTIVTPRGTSVLFEGVQDGETLPCWAKKVMSTGTTATNIVAYFG